MTELKEELSKITQGHGAECQAVVNLRSSRRKANGKRIFFTIAVSFALLAASMALFISTGSGLSFIAHVFRSKLSEKQLGQLITRLEDLHRYDDADELRTQIFLRSRSGTACRRATICLEFARELKQRHLHSQANNWLRRGFEVLAEAFGSEGESLDKSELKILSNLCNVCTRRRSPCKWQALDVLHQIKFGLPAKLDYETYYRLRYEADKHDMKQNLWATPAATLLSWLF